MSLFLSKKIFHCYCSLLTVDGSRVFSQQSTVNSQRLLLLFTVDR
ncbi:hypothetical protein GXM_03215 [Nostoc sphaeroides CCNUC1]|uniref:Uncharacterized protein n=1 Tax=Nostoc sphaeroides CCNUC1 TaxID=2653204 RepID=A0A5P8VZ78_9NOSO|nr:hypothetical protein GXM_03215 [Nostoc sphaeroides CCNUC1]